MADKYFPIRTATSCQLKWNWSTLYLYGGHTASCHRTGWGRLTPATFNTFHNTEKKQEERRRMLAGEWPEESCGYCRTIEESGGYSDRMFSLDIPNQSPMELEINPTTTTISPTILEVFFNNTCNLACLYCIPELSSKINQENKMFGRFENSGIILDIEPKDKNYHEMLREFWKWFDINSHSLKRFNILGGEPFYQAEFDQILTYFENNPHKELELGIITNLMISPGILEKNIKRFKNLLALRHLKRIDITCSIDCWGSEQEYVRYGINLDTWIQNFEYLISHKWLTVNINQTISVLTIKTMPALLEKLITWRKQRNIGHFFSEVTPQPSYLMPGIFGSTMFSNDFQHILSLMPTTHEQDKKAQYYMQGIATHIAASQKQPDEIKKLQIFLNEKDRRRGTNWQTTFPWLTKEMNNVV